MVLYCEQFLIDFSKDTKPKNLHILEYEKEEKNDEEDDEKTKKIMKELSLIR